MKKYIILALVVLLILGAGFFFTKIRESQGTFTPASTLAPVQSTPEPTRPITLKEVARHSTKGNCWVAIEKSVYDMSTFVDMHPGGDAILKGCGTDATYLFNSVPNHTEPVRELLRTFKIGVVVDNKTQ